MKAIKTLARVSSKTFLRNRTSLKKDLIGLQDSITVVIFRFITSDHKNIKLVEKMLRKIFTCQRLKSAKTEENLFFKAENVLVRLPSNSAHQVWSSKQNNLAS